MKAPQLLIASVTSIHYISLSKVITLLSFTVRQIEGLLTCIDYCGSGRDKVNGDNIHNVVKWYIDKGDEKAINCLVTSTITNIIHY